ncbi:unnamed protein product [Ixodes pacificus]
MPSAAQVTFRTGFWTGGRSGRIGSRSGRVNASWRIRMRTTGTRCRSTRRRRRSSRPSRNATCGYSRRRERLNHSKFFFDWNASKYTALDCNQIYKDRHTVQFYGRGYFEGIDHKARKKEHSKFYGELLK